MASHSQSGILDSLTSGFALVARRPYLILVPFLVDLLLWAGPGISARPLVESALGWMLSATAFTRLPPDQLLEFNALARQVADVVAGWNLVGVLGWQLPTFVGLEALEPTQAHLVVGSYAVLIPLVLGLALAGLLIACLFLAPLGQVVRGIRLNLPSLATGLGHLWLRFTGYLALVVLLGTVLGTLGILVIGLANAISPLLAGLVMLLAIGGGLLVTLYLFLGDEAVVAGGAGPAGAIKQSASIVARHFWSVVGLFLLVHIISVGLRVVWGTVGAWKAGLWVAVLGNAFVATGLAASVMVYYWGRRPLLPEPSLSPISAAGVNTGKGMAERWK